MITRDVLGRPEAMDDDGMRHLFVQIECNAPEQDAEARFQQLVALLGVKTQAYGQLVELQ